jgi:hypothetical protein
MIPNAFVSARRSATPKGRTMSRLGLGAAALCLVGALRAQTNIFPASGNVGIGTTSPTTLLQVGNGTNNFAGFSFNNTSVPQIFFGLQIGTNMTGGQGETNLWNGYPSASRSVDFRQITGTGTYDTLAVLLPSGHLGFGDALGTASPSYPLHVLSYVSGSPSLTYHSSTAMFGLDVPGGNVELAFGWLGASPYGYWIQSRSTVNTAAPLSLNPLGGNVGIGTTNPQHLLHVAGTIGAEEVIVSATGADYVFQPDYHLAHLTDVSTYIQENHHLPEIPSAAEMQKEGVSLGELQVKLLVKVEELTLHMIQAEERSDRLQAENKDLQKQIDDLKRRISR